MENAIWKAIPDRYTSQNASTVMHMENASANHMRQLSGKDLPFETPFAIVEMCCSGLSCRAILGHLRL